MIFSYVVDFAESNMNNSKKRVGHLFNKSGYEEFNVSKGMNLLAKIISHIVIN